MRKAFKYQSLTTIVIGIIVSYSLSGQEITKENIFFYYAALNNMTVENCIDQYGSSFDTYNYNQANSDGFERNRYKEKIKNIVSEGLNKINYNDKFVTVVSGKLGEYSFSDHSFPIESINFRTQKNITSTIRTQSGNNVNTMTFYINDDVINQNYFSWALKMSENEASSFIAGRKDNRGYVNRNVHFFITYSILNRPTYNNDKKYEYRFKGYVYSIEIFGDNNKLLGVLYPSLDYYDKVHGIKMKTGEEIIYHTGTYRDFWSSASLTASIYKELPSKEGASYYRVIKYQEGKIIEVTDYFISGRPAIKGTYWQYCAQPEYANGQFIWYYENGLKKQQVNYVNGKMEGCYYAWDDNGECADWTSSTFIKNGMPSGQSRDCACKDQNKKSDETIEPPKVVSDEGIKSSEDNTSNRKKISTKILTSSLNGTESKTYLTGNTDIYTNKKSGTKEKSDFLFLFNYKDGKNDNIKPEVKDYIITQFQNWIKESLNAFPISLDNLNENSLFRVELIFTVRLFAIKSLDAYIDTRVYIVKDGKLILDESFKNSKSLFMESNEPYAVLDNVIKNSEKKISKILGDYVQIQ